jgi:hypothetical protein
MQSRPMISNRGVGMAALGAVDLPILGTGMGGSVQAMDFHMNFQLHYTEHEKNLLPPGCKLTGQKKLILEVLHSLLNKGLRHYSYHP